MEKCRLNINNQICIEIEKAKESFNSNPSIQKKHKELALKLNKKKVRSVCKFYRNIYRKSREERSMSLNKYMTTQIKI